MVDARTRDWDHELLARAGLPDRFLPPLVQPGTRLGTLRPSVAEETGLPADVPVIWVQHESEELVPETDGWHYVPELQRADAELGRGLTNASRLVRQYRLHGTRSSSVSS